MKGNDRLPCPFRQFTDIERHGRVYNGVSQFVEEPAGTAQGIIVFQRTLNLLQLPHLPYSISISLHLSAASLIPSSGDFLP